jgi:class 3 adenylate cyclase
MMSAPGAEPPRNEPDSRSAAQWLAAVRREERRGEMLAAFDLAERGLAEHAEDRSLKHRAVLALARAGATEEAARRFAEYRLDGAQEEDIAALRARIAKDYALLEEGAERRRRAQRAAELYGAVFTRTGGYYPAINAATLSLIAGDAARSRELAAVVLRRLAESGDDSYYAAATAAEAHLLLGDEAAAGAALGKAAARHGEDYGALASTRRQLRAICEIRDVNPELLAPLAGPGVVYFCGHRIAAERGEGRFPAGAEARAAARIVEVVTGRRAGYAYGALAGGADILWAEALLTQGCELHVVLPFARLEFVELSVAVCGPGWVQRFARCLEAATEVRYATDDAFLGDDVLFRYGGELAMGLALVRARYLDAEAWQLALWDGKPALGDAGTAIDVATWRAAGRPVTIVSPDGEITTSPGEPSGGGIDQTLGTSAAGGPRAAGSASGALRRGGSGRVVRAMLFGDVRGFSTLTDEQLPTFATRVLGALAEVVERHRDEVWHRNTWGDAVYVVLTDAAAAAACALDLQDAMASIAMESEGLPAHLALRLGGHVGPVFPTYDPVLRADGFMGSHVSRTARIEPVTPPGTVYVTEAFAAALVLSADRALTCDYVGHMAAAKGYGNLRMYRLRRTSGGDDPLR